MIRKLTVVLLTIVAMVLGANIVCLAQPQSLLTRHVREVTLNGQAPFVGPLPATQSMRIDIVLPVRDQAGLDSFLQELYDPSSPSYRHFLTVEEFTAEVRPQPGGLRRRDPFRESERLYGGWWLPRCVWTCSSRARLRPSRLPST